MHELFITSPSTKPTQGSISVGIIHPFSCTKIQDTFGILYFYVPLYLELPYNSHHKTYLHSGYI